MKKVLFTLLAAATVLVACDKNETTPVAKDGSREIRFTTNIQTYSVKSVLNEKTVKIIAGAPINQVVEATAADPSTLTPATKLYWAKDQTAKTKFAAIYPSIDVTAAPFDYDVANGDYAFHKDVLFATSGEVAPGQNVALNFAHPFTQVQIAVTNNLEGYDVDAVKVSGLKVNSEVDLLEGTVTPKGENGEIAATKVDAKYNVVIIPQTASPVITVTMKKGEETKNCTYVLAEPVAFAANKIYSAAVTVKAEETPQQVEVSLGFNVTEWTEAATPLAYTESEVSVTWGVIGLGEDWEHDIVMACTTKGENPGEGVFEADITYGVGDVFKLRQDGDWKVVCGMKDGWTYYGTGDFDEGYLKLQGKDDPAANIALQVCGEMHLRFEYPNCRFIISPKGETTANTGTLTLYVDDQSGWDALSLYVWAGDDKPMGNWPGTAAPAETEVVNEVTYKKWVVENLPGRANIILNDGKNEGATQTDTREVRLTSQDTKLYLKLKSDKSIEVIE